MQKNYGQRAIEVIAQNVLKEFDEKIMQEAPKEIPIEELIEFHFGLTVQYRNLSKEGGIHGITVFEDSIVPLYNSRLRRQEATCVPAGTILIDKRLLAPARENRLRFTLAHELSHWLIHRDYFQQIEELASKTSLTSVAKTEREADSLASALLMPYGRVKVAFFRLQGKLSKEATIYMMSITFGVSKQSMALRLKEIGFY